MKETIEKMQKQQQKLEVELKQKESELEDLGCWRWLLAKVGLMQFKPTQNTFSQRKKPIKQLTGTRKQAWKKEKQKFFKGVKRTM